MRIAVVGCGQIADAHIQEARRIPGTDVVAVCDTNIHMAEQASARFGIAGQYTDLGRMLAETRPDVVHITTPPASHLAIGTAVLEHGAHAYVEKPFTVTAAEAEALVDHAERAGRLLCVGHSNAFDSSFLRLRDACDNGELGEIVHVDTLMGYNLAGPFGSMMLGDPTHWVHRLPGGLAQNNISHPLSLLLPFLPDDRPALTVERLRWRSERFGDIRDRFADELRVTLLGERTTAALTFSCRMRPVQLFVTVYGSKAQATASIDGRTFRVVRGAELPGPFARVQWAYREHQESRRELRRHAASLVRARLHYFEGLKTLIERFYLAVDGRAAMPLPMSEAVRTARLMDAIFSNDTDRSGESR
jgi:predicted dehydrogenase